MYRDSIKADTQHLENAPLGPIQKKRLQKEIKEAQKKLKEVNKQLKELKNSQGKSEQ